MEKVSLSLLEEYEQKGLLRKQWHPSGDLMIVNYSEIVQFDRLWDDITLQARGLILDTQGHIIARPFPKFFNMEELETIPNEPFEVFEKVDGSLGILYWIEGNPMIASRGSFSSEQATKATEMLHSTYAHALKHLNPSYTYLFEIIYPENKIVVDYGQAACLILLGIIHTKSGVELPVEDIGFPMVRQLDMKQADFKQLKQQDIENQEGYVIRFQSGYRMKIKFDTYVSIHKVVTQLSTTAIWENLKDNNSIEPILAQIPDEYFEWIRQEQSKLREQYRSIEEQCLADFKVLSTRKETAAYFLSCAFPKVLFSMLDKRPYNHIIWRMIRPEFRRAFSN